MAKQLGCNFDIKSLKSKFEFKKDTNSIKNICIFPDPAHMIKLVRNTFGEKKILLGSNNSKINFIYLQKLLRK